MAVSPSLEIHTVLAQAHTGKQKETKRPFTLLPDSVGHGLGQGPPSWYLSHRVPWPGRWERQGSCQVGSLLAFPWRASRSECTLQLKWPVPLKAIIFFASLCLRHSNWNWKLPPQWLLCPAYANLLINVSFPEAAIIPDICTLILSRFNCLRCKHGYWSFRFGNKIQVPRTQPKQCEPGLLSKYYLLRLKDHSAL